MAIGLEGEGPSGSSADRMVTAMREGAARLSGIIQSAMDGIITVDERQDIVIFNPAAEAMFGCTAADVLGTPLEQFIPLRFRDRHHSYVGHFGETGMTTRRMGGQSEITGLRANGEEFPLDASISQAVVGGKKLFTVILRDITHRKQAEAALRDSAERYQRLVELVPNAIWVEREERITFVNRACVQILGAESGEQLLGKSPLDLIHPDFHALATTRRSRLREGLETEPLVEKKVIRLDGEVRDVEITEASFYDEGKLAVLAVLRDVTERKRAERELEESREQLRRLSTSLQAVREEEKTRIARELHDELGQSLTGLKMDLVQLVNQLRPDQSDAISHAKSMQSLLDITVASVRRIATELRPLMLDDLGLVPTIEWLVHDFSQRSGIAVELELPAADFDAGPELSTAVFRVLQESLTNVLRHAQASRVAVALKGSDNSIELRVQDNGRGISPAAASGTKTLGVLGMRERTAMLDGKFILESEPGVGTSIVMTIPRQSESEEAY
jgi:two-component system, NarL family, sensor histidine kinase UhpB